jgi:hypothetical protein
LIDDKLNQTAVYWGSPTQGQWGTTFADPVEIACRWQVVRKQYLDANTGQIRTSRAVIYSNVDLDLGGYLWLGELAELPSGQNSPLDLAGAYEIKGYEKHPSLDGLEFLRKAML